MRLSLVLPTLDEAENLRTLLPQLLALEVVHEIIVVDDGSTDDTREVARSFDRVRLVARSGPRSLVSSLQEGIDAARAELVGWMDADGTMPAEDVPRLVSAVAMGADLAVGSRFVPGGALKGQTAPGFLGALRSLVSMRDTPDGWLGAALSWALNAVLLRAILGGAHDWTSGFLVARRAAIADLRLRGDHGEYFLDLFVRAERAGLTIVEVPVKMRPRAHGRSKTGVRLADFLRRGTRYLSRAIAVRAGR